MAIVSDVLLGRWMHLRSCREPLVGSIFAGILSGLLYAIAQGVGGDSGLWIVFVSRLFLGFTRGLKRFVYFAYTDRNQHFPLVHLYSAYQQLHFPG